MESPKKPFLYHLHRTGKDNQDLLFKRIWDDRLIQRGSWGMHLDIDDPSPAKVLIFVEVGTKEDVIIHEINEAQTYFREQIEPLFPEGE